MSLRKPRGEDWEQEEKPGALESDTKKVHTLRQLGRFWSCACGKVYSWAKTRSDAELCQSMHQKAVIEFVTDQRNGKSNYADE